MPGGALEDQAFANPFNLGIDTTTPKGPSVFEQAGTIQATGQTEGAAAEVAGLQEAINLLDALMSGGSTASGFGTRLDEIIAGDSFSGLVDERQRAATAQLGASGLNRSGAALETASAIPTELAFGIENQLFGREANLTQLIAQMLGQQGFSTAGGIRGAAEAEAGGILGEEGFLLQQQQQKDQNQANLFSGLGGAIGFGIGGPVGGSIGSSLGSVFSDPRLKENVRVEGKIGPLDLVRWDWIPEVKDTIVSKFNTFGFLSTQVKEHFPDVVSSFGGFDVIDMGRLMVKLDG